MEEERDKTRLASDKSWDGMPVFEGLCEVVQSAPWCAEYAGACLKCLYTNAHSMRNKQVEREARVPLRTGVIPPQVLISVPPYRKEIKLSECVQRRATKMVKGLEGKTYEEWLRSLGLFSLEKRRLRDDLIAVYTFLEVGSRVCADRICTGQ